MISNPYARLLLPLVAKEAVALRGEMLYSFAFAGRNDHQAATLHIYLKEATIRPLLEDVQSGFYVACLAGLFSALDVQESHPDAIHLRGQQEEEKKKEKEKEEAKKQKKRMKSIERQERRPSLHEVYRDLLGLRESSSDDSPEDRVPKKIVQLDALTLFGNWWRFNCWDRVRLFLLRLSSR